MIVKLVIVIKPKTKIENVKIGSWKLQEMCMLRCFKVIFAVNDTHVNQAILKGKILY
jgi:hypothetical protein